MSRGPTTSRAVLILATGLILTALGGCGGSSAEQVLPAKVLTPSPTLQTPATASGTTTSDPGTGSTAGRPSTGGPTSAQHSTSGQHSTSSHRTTTARAGSSCGRAPSGTEGGKTRQAIVFPAPGTGHHWPDKSVRLRACATSGLAVSYTLGADPSGFCALSGTTLSVTQPARCQVTASQPGDATHAAAAPVTRTFAVTSQVVEVHWVGGVPGGPVDVSSGSKTVTLVLRARSPDGAFRIAVSVSGGGDACPGFDSLQQEVSTKAPRLKVPVTLSQAGTCTVQPSVDGDQVVNGAQGAAVDLTATG